MPRAAGASVEVEGVRITHPEKRLWPEEGISKLELARYYERLAPVLLRYVKDRPLTLRPFPRGIGGPGFYLKNAPKGAPKWLATFRDVAESTGKPVDFVVAEDARTLVWLAQYNAIEVHPWLSRTDDPAHPDWAVVDLDPPEEAPFERVVRAARAVHAYLEERGLRSFPKLSGSTGIHVLVPLARVHTFDHVREFFAEAARALCQAHPELITPAYEVAERGGRVLLDYAQNAYGKTTVAPYSVRPKPGAPVSMPLTWEELERRGAKLRADQWTLRNAFERLEREGDALEPALKLQQRLPPC